MSLRFPPALTPQAPPLLSLSLFLFSFFWHFPPPLILPLGVKMWGFSLVASRSVFCYNHRQLLGGSDPALSTAAWLHTATCHGCTCRSGLPPSPLHGSGTGAIIQFWDASVCLFVNHRLSSTVTPPTFPLRLRSGPLRQWLFWPWHPGTVISTTATHTHRSSTCVCS